MPDPARRSRLARLAATTAALVVAVTLLFASSASALACTWSGATSTDWSDATNWSGCANGTPGSSDDVTIGTASKEPTVSSGTATANSITLTHDATLTVSGGSLTVGGQVTAPSTSNVSLSGGSLSFGTLLLDESSGLTVSGGSLSGTLSATAATTLAIAPSDFGAGLTLGSNVTVQQTADVTMTGGTLAIGNHTYQLTNNASLLAGSGDITISSGGKLQKLGGNLQSTVQPHVISSGTIEDSSDTGGDLELNPTVAGDELAGTVMSDSQNVVFGNGNYQIDSPGLTLSGIGGSYITSGSAHIDLHGQTLTTEGNYQMENGASITGSGTISGSGFIALNSTGISLKPGAGNTMSIDDEVLQVASTDLSGAGTISLGGTWICFTDVLDSGGTTLDVASGGKFRHVGNSNATVAAPITDAGTVEQFVASNAKLTIDSMTVTPTGAVVDGVAGFGPPPSGSRELDIVALSNLSSGTLTGGSYAVDNGAKLGLPGSVTNLAAVLEVDNDGSVVKTSDGTPALAGLTIAPAGKLSGSGTIPGTVTNAGTVSPGPSSGPGTLSITGNYTQSPGGKLAARFTGTGAGDFDQLSVAGNLTLAGTLAISPGSAYAAAPASGDSAPVITYSGTRTGKFTTTTTTPAMAGGKAFGAIYNDAGKNVSAVVGDPPANTLAPSVSGPAVQGHTLSATNGSWSHSPTSFAYAWQDCNASGTSCSNIAGASKSTYLLTAADVGHRVRAIVTAANSFGSSNAMSAASTVIAPPPPPVISGAKFKASSFAAKRGTSLFLTLSEPATITVLIKGKVSGRKVDGRCKPGAKKGRHCSIRSRSITLRLKGKAGANAFAFKPRGLKPGKYTATIIARDSGGRTSTAIVLHFSVR
jgi:hypothetical protein